MADSTQMASLRIQYLDGSYEPACLRASLVYKGREGDTPIEISEIRLDPRGILRHEKDTRSSTPEVAVINFHPDHDLLADDKKFWEEIGAHPSRQSHCSGETGSRIREATNAGHRWVRRYRGAPSQPRAALVRHAVTPARKGPVLHPSTG